MPTHTVWPCVTRYLTFTHRLTAAILLHTVSKSNSSSHDKHLGPGGAGPRRGEGRGAEGRRGAGGVRRRGTGSRAPGPRGAEGHRGAGGSTWYALFVPITLAVLIKVTASVYLAYCNVA